MADEIRMELSEVEREYIKGVLSEIQHVEVEFERRKEDAILPLKDKLGTLVCFFRDQRKLPKEGYGVFIDGDFLVLRPKPVGPTGEGKPNDS